MDLSRASRVKSTSRLLDGTAPAGPHHDGTCSRVALPWAKHERCLGLHRSTGAVGAMIPRARTVAGPLSAWSGTIKLTGADDLHRGRLVLTTRMLKIARCGHAAMRLVAFGTGDGSGHRIASKLEILRQPCYHSQFHPAPPCNSEKCSLLLGLGNPSFKPLRLLGNFTGHGSVLPAIS